MFAYGSNMHLADLARWMREQGHGAPAIHACRVAALEDATLSWRYYSKSRRGGAATIVFVPGQRVHGVVLDVDARTFRGIDAKEGHPHRYDRGESPRSVTLADGGRVEAWVYEVTPAFVSPEPVPPRRAYRDLLVAAAREHGLPPSWIAQLEATPVIDP